MVSNKVKENNNVQESELKAWEQALGKSNQPLRSESYESSQVQRRRQVSK